MYLTGKVWERLMPSMGPCRSRVLVKGDCHGGADSLSKSGRLDGAGERTGESKSPIMLLKEDKRDKQSHERVQMRHKTT